MHVRTVNQLISNTLKYPTWEDWPRDVRGLPRTEFKLLQYLDARSGIAGATPNRGFGRLAVRASSAHGAPR